MVDDIMTAELSRNVGVNGGVSEPVRDQAALPPKEGPHAAVTSLPLAALYREARSCRCDL